MANEMRSNYYARHTALDRLSAPENTYASRATARRGANELQHQVARQTTSRGDAYRAMHAHADIRYRRQTDSHSPTAALVLLPRDAIQKRGL